MSTDREAGQVRRRRRPEEAHREILDAAEQSLVECPFRELSVEDLMRRTGMTRSTFYHYFPSLDAVAVALLQGVRDEMIRVALPSMRDREDPARSIRQALVDVARVYARHGRVLAAIHEASFRHQAVRAAWREGVVEEWIGAVAAQLRARRDRGLPSPDDPAEVARSLVLMNTAVFAERLGTDPPASPEEVAETLARIWIGAVAPETLGVGD